MTLASENLAAFDIAVSLPADNLYACVDHALTGLGEYYPAAELPTPQWVIGTRAAELGIAPIASQSANGSCRMVACRDGWLALNLARDDDWSLLNAWLQSDESLSEWSSITAALLSRDGASLLGRGREMGMAVALVPNPTPHAATNQTIYSLDALRMTRVDGDALGSLKNAKVVDLSALWAGPLCAHLLGLCGAQVTTVSSVQRPDGARHGSPDLYRQLHEGHRMLALDFAEPSQRQYLAELLADADVVIEASRPRALNRLSLDRDSLNTDDAQLWLSITAYGRTPPADQWIGFGDDVAASAGLVHWSQKDIPTFVGDAIADPLTGVFAALAVADALSVGRAGMMDFPMAMAAGFCRDKITRAGKSIVCPLESLTHAD